MTGYDDLEIIDLPEDILIFFMRYSEWHNRHLISKHFLCNNY